MGRNLCIAIAVSTPQDLDFLPGAIPSANRIAQWASSQDYDVEVVSDEFEPVTCARLAEVLHRRLGQGGQDRLIVSFAGHGLIRGGAEEYWLLNSWRKSATEAVNYLKLRDRLGTYRPKQLAIISDACRSLPIERAKWVEGNGVVDIKDYVEDTVQIATLNATRSAQPAYATPLGAEEAYCFFTQVLTNALEGRPGDVIQSDAAGNEVVFNDRLYSVVDRELRLLASQYQRRQVPDLQGSWRDPHHAWSDLSKMPTSARGPVSLLIPTEKQFMQATREGHEQSADEALAIRQERLEEVIRDSDAQPFPAFIADQGLVVNRQELRDVAASPGLEASILGRDIVTIPEFPGKSASVLIQLANKSWIGAAIYKKFIGTFDVDQDGAQAYVLRQVNERISSAVSAVAKAALGGDLGDPFALAAKLRDFKHTDPVLGALASYVYARGGFIDEVRRLCYFYAELGQPAPFDAILLARVPIRRSESGREYIAELPAIEERLPRNSDEVRRSFTHRATPASEARVAGHFPWLRQGWSLLEDDFRSEFRSLSRFAVGLRPSLFTTFNPREGANLAAALRGGDI